MMASGVCRGPFLIRDTPPFPSYYYATMIVSNKERTSEMNVQDIKNQAIDYIRNSGENATDYDVDAIADDLWDCGYDGGEVEFFERVVFEHRIAE